MLHEIRRTFFCGLDLAQTYDYSALAFIEQEDRREILGAAVSPDTGPLTKPYSVTYTIRDIMRWRRVSYVDIATQVAGIFGSPTLRPALTWTDGTIEREATYPHRPSEPVLVMDATGIGAPVRDHLRSLGLTPVPVILTKGDAVHGVAGVGVGTPKRDLVQTLLVLFGTQRLKIPDSLPLLPVLMKEISNFRMSISQSGYDSYGASTGHSDLVMSVALAVWWAEHLMKRGEHEVRPLPPNFAVGFYAR